MNKKVSKALAAVLSAAMAASAFAMSTSASFAAGSNNVEVVTKPSSVAITTESTYQITDDNAETTVELVANDQTVSGVKVEATGPWVTSDPNVASVDEAGNVTITETGASTVKTVTFTRNVKVTSEGEVEYNSHNKTQTVSANGVERVDVTIYPEDYKLVAEGTPTTGKPATTAATVSVNESTTFSAYQVTDDSDAAKYTKISDVSAYEELGNDFTTSTADNTLTVNKQDPDDVNVGATASIRVKGAEDIQPATLTVEDTYDVASNTTFSQGTEYGQAGKTYSGDDYDVTNMDVVGVDGNETVTVNKGAVVGDITGTAGTVNVDGATTGDINVGTGTVSVTATTAAATTSNITAPTVNVNSKKDAKYAISTGDITSGTTVTIAGVNKADAEGAYAPIETGNITGKAVNVTASQNTYKAPEGAVTVGNIVATGTITLEAGEDVNSMTLGTISGKEGHYADCPYTAKLVVNGGTFNLGDLTYIGEITIGNKTKKTTVTVGKVDTGTYSNSTTNCDLTSASKVTIKANARLNASSVKTVQISGDGTLQVPEAQLTVTEATGVTQKATNIKLIVPGMTTDSTLYTTSSQLPNLFKVVGADSLKEEANDGAWIYKPQNIVFAGIEMTQDTVEVGTSPVTLSIKTIPDSTTLPEGVTVKWEADKDTVELTPSADGMSCTVTATGYTANNANGSNNVVVKATLMNENGTAYSANNVFFTTAETSVTLTGEATVPANPFAVVVTNGEGQQITCDPNGSTVITVPQSMAFNFAISSEETVDSFDYTVGNGSIGGTNTNTVWNGTSGSYQIYAAGAVGAQTGVYVNGIKIFTLEVADRPFESDTTINMDLKVGQKYQFEITLDDPTADFTFKTADGAALSTSYNPDTYPAENGKYYCSVTAQQAGRDIGVYCEIDGKTYKIFTAHTIA